ncbi:MAG TPA: L,D-transpeptidase family protein [Nitrospiria bacterium]|jgi:L,D-transpeptidase ErfK/SrfK
MFKKWVTLLTSLLLVKGFCYGVENQPQDPTSYSSTRGGAYSYQISEETVIGFPQSYLVKNNESLHEIARFFGLGFSELLSVNPEIDPWLPPKGTPLIIPTVWILPDAEDKGIVINIAELRLYYFFEAAGLKMVKTFPIGIGREGLSTPVGVFRITDKLKDPSWFPPASARREDPSLPQVIPLGLENPLGGYWLQLSVPGYGIHGTNRPWGVGRKISRGCIRLYPEDMPWLFDQTARGLRVEIVNQPLKVGFKNGGLYIQVHKNNLEPQKLYHAALSKIKEINLGFQLDPKTLQEAITKNNGLPHLISG